MPACQFALQCRRFALAVRCGPSAGSQLLANLPCAGRLQVSSTVIGGIDYMGALWLGSGAGLVHSWGSEGKSTSTGAKRRRAIDSVGCGTAAHCCSGAGDGVRGLRCAAAGITNSSMAGAQGEVHACAPGTRRRAMGSVPWRWGLLALRAWRLARRERGRLRGYARRKSANKVAGAGAHAGVHAGARAGVGRGARARSKHTCESRLYRFRALSWAARKRARHFGRKVVHTVT